MKSRLASASATYRRLAPAAHVVGRSDPIGWNRPPGLLRGQSAVYVPPDLVQAFSREVDRALA